MRAKSSRGQTVVELLLGLIVFMILFGTVAGFSAYLYTQHVFIAAAREGARVAATHPNFVSGSDADAEADVRTKVTSFIESTAGIDIIDDDIDITAPLTVASGGVIGNRTVTVSVTHDMDNPIPVGDFLQALGASSTSTENLKHISLSASATMRYEE